MQTTEIPEKRIPENSNEMLMRYESINGKRK